jgi:two-component system sensor histidine kinase/response regulator
MKADDSLCHIPVIMISALQELDSVVKCLEMGADDYLFKPFNPTLLKARVLACLFKKRARDREMFHFAQLQQNFRRLEDLEKLRDDLTHMIIHDLRTPLTSLISGILTLEIIGDLNGDQREVLATSIQGGETLLSIINDLLDVEKLESGVMRLDYADLAYGDLVASAVGQVRSLVSSKELNLVLGIGPDLPNVCADANKIRRTMVNLLGNAIKFTPEGGTITIRANVNLDAQEMEFSVSDTGPGIAAEYFDRIFEKFGQIASTSGGVSSTGLGLTFCKLAVEAHKGHISVESYPPAGSTFNFAIPIAR